MNHSYDFYTRFAKVVNSGQARSVLIHGNVEDLFFSGRDYVPLLGFLLEKTRPAPQLQLVYELNGPIRLSPEDKDKLKSAWVRWKAKLSTENLSVSSARQQVLSGTVDLETTSVDALSKQFDRHMHDAIGNATLALEFMRQLCYCSRDMMRENLLIFIEAADMLIPAGRGDIASLGEVQQRRLAILQDWFSEAEFVNGGDTVVLLSESISQVHPRIGRLPQLLSLEVPAPGLADRLHFCEFQKKKMKELRHVDAENCASLTAGLSIHALRQLLLESAYTGEELDVECITVKVEEFIQSQMGEDVVEFKKPHHFLKDVVGATDLKKFLKTELIPRFQATGESALSGCAVAGPIGGGKTFIFEAVAAEIGVPVLVLKNLRSQWFGQTDVIFERLRRLLEALDKVLIFIDEADTQFGRVDGSAHETERRLTGKVQQMMSDPRLKGKVLWLLMTARIELLSPDIRRPGRAGDLILPVLDPEASDRKAFVKWTLRDIVSKTNMSKAVKLLDEKLLQANYSAAAFAALRAHLKAHPLRKQKQLEHLEELVGDLISPAIEDTRRRQTLQALLNCTRRSLLPEDLRKNAASPEALETLRTKWEIEIAQLG